MADEVTAHSDGLETGANRFEPGVVQRHRLMADSRKWILSKCLPCIYGDKVDVTSGGEALQSVDVGAAVEALLAALPALAPTALPAPVVLDAEATPVDGEGDEP